MTLDYLVASLPPLTFGGPAAISRAAFNERCGQDPLAATGGPFAVSARAWRDLDAQLRNAMCEARGGERWRRPTAGLSLYWKSRVFACFQETDVAKRDELLDKVWWDAAGELTPAASPLGAGAVATYAVRLDLALKRQQISPEQGNAVFDRLTAETKGIL